MSEEKKVNETEETKVNKAEEKHGVELTDEELAQVTGGASSDNDGESSEFRKKRASRDPSKMV